MPRKKTDATAEAFESDEADAPGSREKIQSMAQPRPIPADLEERVKGLNSLLGELSWNSKTKMEADDLIRKYIGKHQVTPVVEHGSTRFYRTSTLNKGKVPVIGYTAATRTYIKALTRTEMVQMQVACSMLHLNPTTIRKLMLEGVLKGTMGKVNLESINMYQASGKS